ncbi:zinc finger (MYND type) family protein / programmed cell death 2 C-terminal domain-containing protein [Zea mays]|uniref:Zinc finger (MYND type) family protein / programmed cell death 2 C-terminal domain-containing protein n=1 Tax=Zea mays TaxID=4577 RepID=A0A1D6EI12_MAIZE|nr:zinc finger (MYND type) family protein / programmed cell death 2 C-terminal domain-containing protein [Zea mays]
MMARAAAGGKDRDGVGGGRGGLVKIRPYQIKFRGALLAKNLGSWLGKFTIGRNQALRAKEIDPKSLIVEAYEKGLMIAVIPFTSKILEPCQSSIAYRPPNPWTMGILSLLAEIYNLPNLKMNLKFDIEVLFKNLTVDILMELVNVTKFFQMPKYLLPAHVCHWCGTWKGDKICSSCKKARYCSEKHQALHWGTGHKNDCLQIISSSAASNSVLPTVGKVPANTSWPKFEIKIDYEGIFDSDSGDENNSKLLVMQRHGKPDAMMESWMDQFEADSDNKCWTSFQERVSRAPNQVLRYCREPNAKPLWALSSGCPSNVDIPSCSYCKDPLCYEFQARIIKFDVDNVVMVTGGRNTGRVGVIKNREKHKASFETIHVLLGAFCYV